MRPVQRLRLIQFARVAAALTCLATAFGCSDGGGSVAVLDPTVGGSRTIANLQVTLASSKRAYNSIEQVAATTTLKNVGATAMNVTAQEPYIYTTATQGSFNVTTPDLVQGVTTTYTLQPGETKAYPALILPSQLQGVTGKLALSSGLTVTSITANGQTKTFQTMEFTAVPITVSIDPLF